MNSAKLHLASILAALALVILAAGTGPASAVNVSTTGIGDAIVAPYYTTRRGWGTLFNLTNTQNVPILVRVRIQEGLNSRDVLDFTIGLSSFDVISAALRQGPNGRPELQLVDQIDRQGRQTCTVPATTSGQRIPLNNFGYSDDGGPPGLDRLREGYIEFIVLGYAEGNKTGPLRRGGDIVNLGNAIEQHACDDLEVALGSGDNPTTGLRRSLEAARQAGEPINALKLSYSLLNGGRGVEVSGHSLTWANFYEGNPGGALVTPNNNANCSIPRGDTRISNREWLPGGANGSCNNLVTTQSSPEFFEPSLNDAFPPVARILDDDTGSLFVLTPDGNSRRGDGRARGVDALSLTIQNRSLINEWSSNPGVATNWIVTMPTKGLYVDAARNAQGQLDTSDDRGLFAINGGRPASMLSSGNVPYRPFQNEFRQTQAGNPNSAMACNDVAFTVYDRAEQSQVPPSAGGTNFSPAEPEATTAASLCREANVITFDGRSVFGAINPVNIDTRGLSPNRAGWMLLELDTFGGASIPVTNPTTQGLRGLPTVGFMVKQRSFGSVSANYATSVEYSTVRTLGPPVGPPPPPPPPQAPACTVPIGTLCLIDRDGEPEFGLVDLLLDSNSQNPFFNDPNRPRGPLGPLASEINAEDLAFALETLLRNDDGSLLTILENLFINGQFQEGVNLLLTGNQNGEGDLPDILQDLLVGDNTGGGLAGILGDQGVAGLGEALLIDPADPACQAALGSVCLITGPNPNNRQGLLNLLLTDGRALGRVTGNLDQDQLVAILGNTLASNGSLADTVAGLFERGQLADGLQVLLLGTNPNDPAQSGLADALGQLLNLPGLADDVAAQLGVLLAAP